MKIRTGIEADFWTASILAANGALARATAIVDQLELALAVGKIRPRVQA